eukprot:scaffold18634_cov17-Tisochrysis_lutea.AAC.2
MVTSHGNITWGRHIFHAGFLRPDTQLGSVQVGETCQTAMRTGRGNYLANLTLYPGQSHRAPWHDA